MVLSIKKEGAPILVDDNPIQIADVLTAVEREGSQVGEGADIDVMGFMYQSGTSINMNDLVDMSDIHDLIDAEIERVEQQSKRGTA